VEVENDADENTQGFLIYLFCFKNAEMSVLELFETRKLVSQGRRGATTSPNIGDFEVEDVGLWTGEGFSPTPRGGDNGSDRGFPVCHGRIRGSSPQRGKQESVPKTREL